MNTMELSCILMGQAFSPAHVEKVTGYQFAEKNEPGEIAKVGRYKGLPLPYGSSILRDEPRRESILNFLEKHQSDLAAKGVASITLQLNVAFESQCNFELTAGFMSRIARLSIPLSISCYERDGIS